jgi:GTP-binding protein HflX
LPIVALVGYTNAGKSTLFNRLTGSDVFAKSMLFATLDPTLRQLPLANGRSVILSDTVGFISDLPHELVEAFRATLDEVREADVILHVRDIASGDSEAQNEDVKKVLEEIGVGRDDGRRIVEVWNKIDLVEADARDDLSERALRARAVMISSVTGEGIDDLLGRISALIDSEPERVFELRADDGEALAWLYRHGRVTDREVSDRGLKITARLDAQALGRFERMRPSLHGRLAAE